MIPPKSGLKKTKKELIKEIEHLEKIGKINLSIERRKVFEEQRLRVAAQRGLVPYVRSLESFDRWLLKRPQLRGQLQGILQELGLWQIRLGYDPDQDLSLSAISPQRMNGNSHD